MRHTWRDHAKKVILQVIKENKGCDEKTMRKKLRDAYPYGQRAMHPYKVWCDQVNKTLVVLYSKNNLFPQSELFK